MTPKGWRRIDELLQEALDRLPDERAAFLGEVCTDDATRIEIESLLSYHDRAAEFLEVPAFEAAAELLCEDHAEEMVGLLIGSYKIERLLGAGGMGEVYLAEDTKLGRQVAIKFLPAYLETDELAKRRLVKEAKAAAKLDHPNICTIHEVLEIARHSFIVMQCVRGQTLASRIQQAPLEVCDALDIAAQVADALAEAHSHGIIHRDIKPQNVMLTSRGQVKVLDFGLAKIVRSTELQAQSHSQLSAPGIIVGTAAYMSPEQARGDFVDTRSDLFSLGVLLYESVAGRAPFSGATPMEICARVIHLDPPPPSHLNPHVPPEVDAIIMKALAKDPSARYESAAAMLQGLRTAHALLQAQPPVTALPPARKSAASAIKGLPTPYGIWRRPRVFVPLAIVILSIALLAFFKILPGGRAKAHQPSPEARRWYDAGTNALRNGTYYDASLALQRATAADDKFPLAHAVLAEAWIELGYVDKANQELLRARSLIHDLSPLPRLEGLYLKAITHVVLREFASAIENYQEITGAAPDTEKASAYVDLGRAYEKNNQLDKAIESYLEAARLAPADVAAFLRLGILYSERGQDLERALEAFQKAEDIYRALGNFEGVAEVFYRRGSLFFNLGKPPEARAQLEKVLEITRTTDNRYQQIRALSVLSNVADAEGDALQARLQANQAIESARANGIDNQVTSGYIWLGNTFLMRGQYSEAEKCYQQGLDLAQRDKDRLNEAWALRSLGSLRTLQHKTDEGLHYLEPARLFFQQGGYRQWLSLTLILMGRAYRDKGDYEAALGAFKDLLQQGEQANDLSQAALAHAEVGSVLAVQEQYSEALGHYDESQRINKLLNAQFSFGYSAMHRGSVLWQIGRYEEARAALGEASSIAIRPSGTYNPLLAAIHIAHARLELSEWRFRDSQARCQQALDLTGAQDKETAVQAKCTLGLARIRSGAARAGVRLCGEAVEIAKTTGDPQLLASAMVTFAEALLDSDRAQPALESALQAQQSFARFEQMDSEWRAWLIAGRAKLRLGEAAIAREYAANAAARLANLEQRLGPEAFNGYRSRPDIQHYRTQLDQLLTSQL